MEIKILQLLDGAKKAEGIAVVIDVFRAFTLEAYLFDAGIRATIPMGSVDAAYKLKEENPQYILAGERGGAILPGFDTGNAPSELYKLDLKGKTVVHTTSAGTQGIANAANAQEILGAGLVNAAATAEYIRRSGCEKVSLVCMGLAAKAETAEDTLCARYIQSILEGTEIDMESEIESLKYTDGAKFFDPSQNHVFPREDFFMSTKTDIFHFAMRYNRETGEMEKIDMN